MKGKIHLVGEPGVPKKKNISSVGPQVITFGSLNPLEIVELVIEFEDRFGVKANGDFLIDETPVKLKPDYRKFERLIMIGLKEVGDILSVSKLVIQRGIVC